MIDRARPEVLLAFSDVGSMAALPLCRRLGIKTIVSMVHGDVREEQELLEREDVFSPEFMPIYLGSSNLDRTLLAWLHERRLRDLALADRVLVPSDHIAETLVRYGTPVGKIRVIPYAADCRRFRPSGENQHRPGCTFLFAGGISQRKGIKYLLEAWRRIRRPGWQLQLLGPLPVNLGPLEPYLDLVEPLGRVSQSEMPARMASADVFVFPSLFEGSAVVTYEALATGLPSVVSPSAGSIVRDGIEGFVVPPSQVDLLARRMEQLGNDPELRARMARAARSRALAFDWPHYHERLDMAVDDLLRDDTTPPPGLVNRHDDDHDALFSSEKRIHSAPRCDDWAVMEDIYYIYATAGVIVLYFLHQVVARRFDAFAPVWLFLVGYLQLYVLQALSFHDWAVEVRGKDLVTAANFRSFWALLWFLLVYQLVPARMAARVLPAPPRRWLPLLPAVICPPLIVWGLFCANMFVAGEPPASRISRVKKRSSDRSLS